MMNDITKELSTNFIEYTAANKLFNDLIGNAVIPRKRYIRVYSAEATYNVE